MTKNFKIGVAYNTFYGLNVIEKSINSIRGVADYIVIVHQKVGFSGNAEPSTNNDILARLLENKLVDDVVYYNNTAPNTVRGVIEKRNIGLNYCRENKCGFIMPMDSDELYDEQELFVEINNMYENNIDTLYCPIYSYYYDELHYFEDTYFVPSVFRINERVFEKTRSSVLTDALRRMKEKKYKKSEMHMHHYAYLKDEYAEKVNNNISAVLSGSLKNDIVKIHEGLLNWSEGEDALVFLNVKNNENIKLNRVKLIVKEQS